MDSQVSKQFFIVRKAETGDLKGEMVLTATSTEEYKNATPQEKVKIRIGLNFQVSMHYSSECYVSELPDYLNNKNQS